MSGNTLILGEQSANSNPAPQKNAPSRGGLTGLEFTYTPSSDGVDENLLILLHGLGMWYRTSAYQSIFTRVGDTHVPFAKLGQNLRLPQTATLALRAPDP